MTSSNRKVRLEGNGGGAGVIAVAPSRLALACHLQLHAPVHHVEQQRPVHVGDAALQLLRAARRDDQGRPEGVAVASPDAA